MGFKVGDRIEAEYGTNNWYPGVVESSAAGGQYNILYDDGDKQVLGADKLRPPTPVETVAAALGRTMTKSEMVTVKMLANSPINHAKLIQLGVCDAVMRSYGVSAFYADQIMNFMVRHEANIPSILRSRVHLKLVSSLSTMAPTFGSQGNHGYILASAVCMMCEWEGMHRVLKTPANLTMLNQIIKSKENPEAIFAAASRLYLGGKDESGPWLEAIQSGVDQCQGVVDAMIAGLTGNKYANTQPNSLVVRYFVGALRLMATSDMSKKVLSKIAIKPLTQVLAAFVEGKEAACAAGGGGEDAPAAIYAIEALLELSFLAETDTQVKALIPDHAHLKRLLERFVKSSRSDVPDEAKRTAASFLRRFEPPKTQTPVKRNKKHIMISYCWANKEIAVEFSRVLRAMGYEVWRDEEGSALVAPMGGDTDEAMAAAIDNSGTILVLVSEKYKDSVNCRFEASYSNALRKKGKLNMIFAMCQPDYTTVSKTPIEGWLAFMIGADLWYGAFSPDKVADAVSQFQSHLPAETKHGGAAVQPSAYVAPKGAPKAAAAGPKGDMDIKDWLISLAAPMAVYAPSMSSYGFETSNMLKDYSSEEFIEALNDMEITMKPPHKKKLIAAHNMLLGK